MGRRLNLSTPTVINTELIPLDESFYIEANGNTEQWYYDNTNVYAPNRNVIPLTLTPRLSVFDGDTKTTYTPTFFMVKWYAKEYNATQGEYVETQITTTDPAATDYVLSGNNLLVKKNIPYSHDVTIRCEATYVDPRDTGVTSTIQDAVTLLTNRDASTISPMLEIDCPASQGFNPLTATTSKYTLKGRASWGQDLANDNIVTFKADPLGTENIIPTNEDSIDSAAPTLSLRYGSINQADQTFMSRQTSGGQVGSIEGSVGYVTNIKGDTVKLNQLFKSSSTTAANMSSFTRTESGFVASAPSGTSDRAVSIIVFKTLQHVYYYHFDYKSSVAFSIQDMNPGGLTAEAATNWKHFARVGQKTQNVYSVLYWYNYSAIETGWNIEVKNCIVLDLTAMGIDNLTTVEQVESWLATHIGTRSYYPYTEGRLINYGGYQVKMNQLVQNGDFRDGVNSWEAYNNNGTISVTNNECTYTITRLGSTMFDNTTNHVIDVVQGHKYYSSYEIYVTKQCSVNRGYYIGYGYMTTVNAGWNKMQALQTGDSTNTTKYRCGIANASQNGYQVGDYYKIKNLVIIDLTLMFGAGNEPDLDWCNAHFTEDYYPYHTGYDTNLLSVADEDLGIKTVGFNLLKMQGRINETVSSLTPTSQHKFSENGYWNGIAVDGYTVSGTITNLNIGEGSVSGTNVRTSYGVGFPIRCEESTRYYIKASCKIGYFDADGVSISYTSDLENTTITTPANCKWMVVVFGTQSGSFSLSNLSVSLSSSKNGTYEPYWESFTDMSWITKIGIENFNIWDEEWESGTWSSATGEKGDGNQFVRCKDYIPVQANTQYYYKVPTTNSRILYYDASKTLISSDNTVTNTVFTTPSNCAYITFFALGTTYEYNICINKSIAHFNGRYYPHGVTAPYFPNGLCNVGSVYDEIKVVDGKIKGVVRFGRVDGGDLTWVYDADTPCFYTSSISNRTISLNTTLAKYGDVKPMPFSASDDKCAKVWTQNYKTIYIKDTTYTDAVTFKSSMVGVPIVYELVTPYEFEIDYPTKSLFEWYGISNNTEVKADTLPWYVDGQNTDTLTVDAMYGEEIRVVLRAKKNYGTDLYPSKAYRSILWRIPDIDSSVLSENGSAVRSDTESMNFGTIVNIKGDTLSDDVKKEHLRFHWRSRRDNTSTETDQGWGLTKELPASALINVKSSPSSRLASTIVYPEVYLLGAYEKVTDDGNDVTEDGELVYDRPVF